MNRTIFTKSIIQPKEFEDGKRISVMSRHTLSDGKTPDTRITENVFDEWLKEFAPPEKLIGAYYREEIVWDDFEKEYISFIKSDEIKMKVKTLAKRAVSELITLMCIEHGPEKCHRRLLAEELQKYEPSLKIIHK